MTSLGMLKSDSTSAAGAMDGKTKPVVVGLMLATVGTSSALASEAPQARAAIYSQTSSGASIVVADRASAGIGELRRLSGLNWEQIARLFGVSRRALHFWASGKLMRSSNEERLQRLLATIHSIDRGTASDNRSLLLTVRERVSPLDLLREGRYQEVVSLLGAGHTQRNRPAKLSEDVMRKRAPRPPEELVEVIDDASRPSSGRLLGAWPIKVPRSK